MNSSDQLRLRRMLVLLIIGLIGLLSSIGELARRLLIAGGIGLSGETTTTVSLMAAALIFLVHTALVARSVSLLLKKGRS